MVCKRRSHAPDYFARLADDSALVLDCRPADRIKPRDQVVFEATAQACAVLGSRYEVVDPAPPVLMGNAPWLSRFATSPAPRATCSACRRYTLSTCGRQAASA